MILSDVSDSVFTAQHDDPRDRHKSIFLILSCENRFVQSYDYMPSVVSYLPSLFLVALHRNMLLVNVTLALPVEKILVD